MNEKTIKAVTSILEDKKGNIWTSSVVGRSCELLCYDGKSLSNQKPTVTIVSDGEKILAAINSFSELRKPLSITRYFKPTCK